MNKRIVRYFFMFFMFFICFICFFILFSIIMFFYIVFSPLLSQDILISSLLYSAGKLAGLIGFLFLSVLIILGDTARFFDKFLGIDKIIKFQRKFALITTIFVLAHPIFFIFSNSSYLTYLLPYSASIPLTLGTVALYFYIVVMVSSALYKRISYQIWQYLHVLTYLLFFLSLYHVLKIGSDTENILVKAVIGVLLICIVMGGIYRAYYKIKHRRFRCYVKKIKWETQNVFTLKLKLGSKLHFKPGQFCFLRINKYRLYARHPFTISSAPNNATLDFTIKMSGKFTQAASQLKKGEEVVVDGPFGIFTVDDNKRTAVFIAGGVGITPFISMIKNNLRLNKQQKIVLIYGSKTKKDIIFRKELERISEKWLKKIFVLSKENVLSKERSSVNWETGRISRAIIKKNINNLKYPLFYVCGPEAMKNNTIKILRQLKIKKQSIKTESFFW